MKNHQPARRYRVKNIADQLPPEIARQIHPDRRKNEAAYWAVREQLLDQCLVLVQDLTAFAQQTA